MKLATAEIGHHVRVIQDADSMGLKDKGGFVAQILLRTPSVLVLHHKHHNLLVKLVNDADGQRLLVSMRGFASLSQEIDVIPLVVQFHHLLVLHLRLLLVSVN